jgi:hypothetical protein
MQSAFESPAVMVPLDALLATGLGPLLAAVGLLPADGLLDEVGLVPDDGLLLADPLLVAEGRLLAPLPDFLAVAPWSTFNGFFTIAVESGIFEISSESGIPELTALAAARGIVTVFTVIIPADGDA